MKSFKCFFPLPHLACSPLSRTLCVTENVFLVSSGTVQLMGSGDLMHSCSGDFTRVGSGGDFTTWQGEQVVHLNRDWNIVKAKPRFHVMVQRLLFLKITCNICLCWQFFLTFITLSFLPAPWSSQCGLWQRGAGCCPCWPPYCCSSRRLSCPRPACRGPQSLNIQRVNTFALLPYQFA